MKSVFWIGSIVLVAAVGCLIASKYFLRERRLVVDDPRSLAIVELKTIQLTQLAHFTSNKRQYGTLREIMRTAGYPDNYFEWSADGAGVRGRYRFMMRLPEGSDRSKYWCVTAWPANIQDQKRLDAFFVDQCGGIYRSTNPLASEPSLAEIYDGSPFCSLIRKSTWQLLSR